MKKRILRLFCLTLTLCLTLALAMPASAATSPHHYEGSYSSYIYAADASWALTWVTAKMGSTAPNKLKISVEYDIKISDKLSSTGNVLNSVDQPYSTSLTNSIASGTFFQLRIYYFIGGSCVHACHAIDLPAPLE